MAKHKQTTAKDVQSLSKKETAKATQEVMGTPPITAFKESVITRWRKRRAERREERNDR